MNISIKLQNNFNYMIHFLTAIISKRTGWFIFESKEYEYAVITVNTTC